MNGIGKLSLKIIILVASLFGTHWAFSWDSVLSNYMIALIWTFGMIAGYWIGAIDLDFGRDKG